MSVPQERRAGRPGGSADAASARAADAGGVPADASGFPADAGGAADAARAEDGASVAGAPDPVGSSASAGPAPHFWRGQRLGFPESGPGSLAGMGARLGAFLTDIVLSALVAGLFTAPELPRNWSLVAFLADYVLFGAAFGQTAGMRLFGLRLVRVDRPARVGVVRVVGRTALLALLIPAVIWDADGRCLHERFTQTAVVRT